MLRRKKIKNSSDGNEIIFLRQMVKNRTNEATHEYNKQFER